MGAEEKKEQEALRLPGTATCNECARPRGPDESDTDPIYLFSGEFFLSAEDLRIRGRGLDFIWKRKYRSRIGSDTAQGNGWDFSYNIRLERQGANVVLFDGNTRRDVFEPSGAPDTWQRREYFTDLARSRDGSYTLTFTDSGTWSFWPLDGSPWQGKIRAIADRNGNSLQFDYDALGRLVTVHDTLDTAAHNRDITVQYNGDGLIESVTDFAGRQVRYEYYDDGDAGGSHGDLRSVRSPIVTGTPNDNDFPAGKTTTYTYSRGFGDKRDHNLLTITDAGGQTILTNVYATTSNPKDFRFDRAQRQIWGDSGDIIDYVFASVVPTFNNNGAVFKVTVNDRVGNVTEHFFDSRNRNILMREYTGRANPDLPTDIDANINPPTNRLRADDPEFFATRWEYNEDSLLETVVRLNGNSETFLYDRSNPDRRAQGNLLQHCWHPGSAGGTPAVICETFEYADGMGGCCGTNFVTRHVDGRGGETIHEYDSFGNRVHTQHRIPSIVEDWTYNAFGQVTSHTLPDNGAQNGHRRLDEYTYHASGSQRGYLHQEIVDAGSFELTTTHQYNSVGIVTRVIDARGNDTLYVVNQLDQVVREISRKVDLAAATRYETDYFFDADDNLVRTDVKNVDDQGQVVSTNPYLTTITEFDVLNNPVRTCQEVGSFDVLRTPPKLDGSGLPQSQFVVAEYGYDENRNRTLVRFGEATDGDQPTNTVHTLYDERNLKYREIRAMGDQAQSTTQYDYDRNRNPKTTSEGLEGSASHITRLEYDGYNRLVRSTDPMGNVETRAYDANHNLTSVRRDGQLVDVAGSTGNVRLREVATTYDAMNRVVRVDTAFFDTETQAPIGDGISSTWKYWSDNSQVLRVVNDNGHARVTEYDSANRELRVTDEKLNVVAYDYDANSNVVARTEVDKSDLGRPDETYTTIYTYDGLDRRTSAIDNVGNTQLFAHDSRGNQALTVDALGNRIRYEYDGLNRPTRTTRFLTDDGTGGGAPAGEIVTEQSWDDSSRLTSQTDDLGNATAYLYDALGRIEAVDYADCTSMTHDYDVYDNRVATTDANGTHVVCGYDALDRLVQKTIEPGAGVDDDTTFEEYAYDGLSRLVRTADDDSEVTRSYNSLSRVTRETLNGATTASFHDGVGNKITCTYPGGRVVTCTYDALERKKTIADEAGPIATYWYVGKTRVERREYGNNTRTDYAYDGLSNAPDDFGVKQIVGTTHRFDTDGANLILDQREYTWDPVYNKTARRDVRAGGPRITHDYEYDSVYRLVRTGAKDNSGTVLRDEHYDLDDAGSRIAVTGGWNPGAYTKNASACNPADAQMNQYTTTPLDTRLYDAKGNLLATIEGFSFRTMRYDYANRMVQHFDSETGVTTAYAYDAEGRRIAKTIDSGGSPDETRFFHDGWQCIEERDDVDVPVATYVHGVYIDEVLQMRRDALDHFHHSDDLYSVMLVTDGTGTVRERYDYGDYGSVVDPVTLLPIAGSPSAIGNSVLFTGRRYDAETGLYDYRTRHLDSRSGQFASRDTIGVWGDEVNIGNGYAYAANNPQKYLDPSGRKCKPVLVAQAGQTKDEDGSITKSEMHTDSGFLYWFHHWGIASATDDSLRVTSYASGYDGFWDGSDTVRASTETSIGCDAACNIVLTGPDGVSSRASDNLQASVHTNPSAEGQPTISIGAAASGAMEAKGAASVTLGKEGTGTITVTWAGASYQNTFALDSYSWCCKDN